MHLWATNWWNWHTIHLLRSSLLIPPQSALTASKLPSQFPTWILVEILMAGTGRFQAQKVTAEIFLLHFALAILQAPLTDTNNLVEWLVWRQLPVAAFNGRPEKITRCLLFLVDPFLLATLNSTDRISKSKLQEFILNCQDIHTNNNDAGDVGGFADWPGDVGDFFIHFSG